jgi:serine/threonine protein kinase
MIVKFIDFGSAAFLPNRRNSLFTTFYGTTQYCPPEILEGVGYRGIESEMWALGILLYTMIFNQPPFKAKADILNYWSIYELFHNSGFDIFIDGRKISRPGIQRNPNRFRHSLPIITSFQENSLKNRQVDYQSEKPSIKITRRLFDLLENLLKKDPSDRIGIEQVCIHPWVVSA